MEVLAFTVINKEIECDIKQVVGDNDYQASFMLDDEWNDKEVICRVVWNNRTSLDIKLEDLSCVIPAYIMKRGEVSIGVYAEGDEQLTTEPWLLSVRKSIREKEFETAMPHKEIWNEINEKIKNVITSNDLDEKVVSSVNDTIEKSGFVKNDELSTKVSTQVNAYLGENGFNDILDNKTVEVTGNNLFSIEDNETECNGVTIKVENNVITMQGEYTGSSNSANIEIGNFTFDEDKSLYVSWWNVSGATVFAIKGDDLNLNFNATEDSVNGNIRNFTAGTKYTVYVKINKTTTPTYINPSSFAPMLSASKPTAYEPYQVETSVNRAISANFKTMMIDSLNQFKGKKILNFGDSIAYGAGNDGVSYAHIIADKLGMSCMSFAKGGATVCQSLLTTNNVVDQVDSCTTENPDIILVEGGTNDISKDDFETSLGEMVSMETSTAWTDSITDDSKTTVAGSLEYIFKTLREKYPQAIILYISVHKMASRKIARQKTVHDLFQQICDKWSVPFIDVYEKGGMNTFLANMCLAYTQDTYNAGTGDATHPNGDGYNTFYVPMIMNEIKKHMEV